MVLEEEEVEGGGFDFGRATKEGRKVDEGSVVEEGRSRTREEEERRGLEEVSV